MSTWQTSQTLSDSPPPKLWAAKYTATVRSGLSNSSFVLNDAAPPDAVSEALRTPPTWPVSNWPSGETDPQRLALLKLKALLDADAGLSANSSAAVRQQLQERFPSIAWNRPKANEQEFMIEAIVRLNDGQPEWGVVHPGVGALPNGIRSDALESGADLKVLIQNLVRADLMQKLGL